MAFHLVVTQPFGDYAKGAKITDQAEIDGVLARSMHAHVVRVTAPDPEAAEPEPKGKSAA